MKPIFLATSLAGGLFFSAVSGLCLEAAPGITTRILLEDANRAAPRQVSDRSTFYDGQRFKLMVKSLRAGYLYVVCQTSQGEAKLLHPSSVSAGNSVAAGGSTTFPQRGWFRFDDEPGTEEVFVILSGSPIPELEQAAENGGDLTPATIRRYSAFLAEDGSQARGIDTTVDSPVPAVKRILLRHDSRPSGL
jgi:hypothetical protein